MSMNGNGYRGMGWLRDLPDFRDRTPETKEIATLLGRSSRLRSAKKKAPSRVKPLKK